MCLYNKISSVHLKTYTGVSIFFSAQNDDNALFVLQILLILIHLNVINEMHHERVANHINKLVSRCKSQR